MNYYYKAIYNKCWVWTPNIIIIIGRKKHIILFEECCPIPLWLSPPCCSDCWWGLSCWPSLWTPRDWPVQSQTRIVINDYQNEKYFSWEKAFQLVIVVVLCLFLGLLSLLQSSEKLSIPSRRQLQQLLSFWKEINQIKEKRI